MATTRVHQKEPPAGRLFDVPDPDDPDPDPDEREDEELLDELLELLTPPFGVPRSC